MPRCAGPVEDETGHSCCCYGWDSEPPEGMTWEDFCDECRAQKDRFDELRGDCKRDEG